MSFAYQDGAPFPGLYPATPELVLAGTAAASGVPTPSGLSFTSVPLSPANQTIQLLPANAIRSFLLIYNPSLMVAQFSLGQATLGAITNLSIGGGQAFFWATAQGLQPVYRGALTAVGIFAPLPLWVWEDATNLYNDGGWLSFTDEPAGYPTSPVGLPPGAVWNDGMVAAIVPGATPDPTAPPLFFGSVTAGQLLLTGGGNLPLANPGAGTKQLWNGGDIVSVA